MATNDYARKAIGREMFERESMDVRHPSIVANNASYLRSNKMLNSKLILSLALATASLGAAANGETITIDKLIHSADPSGVAVASQRGTKPSSANTIVVNGEQGIAFIDAPSTRSRAEVVAELREALRLGATGGGEAGPRPTSAAEEAQIARAGRNAALHAKASADSPS